MRSRLVSFLSVLLMSLALAGCIGGNDTGTPDPFVGSCPSWTLFTSLDDSGRSVQPAALSTRSFHMWNNTSGPEGSGSWPKEDTVSRPITPGSPGGVMLRGEYPVDFYEFTFDLIYTQDVDSRLSVQSESGRPLLFLDMSTGRYASILDFKDGTNKTSEAGDFPSYRVVLSQPEAEPAPEGIQLIWHHEPNKDKDTRTNSFSFAVFEIHAWFRTCGSAQE